MEFIVRHDWLHRGTESREFLTERALQRSNIHKILSGRFRDPLISDEDSDEDQHHDIEALINNFSVKNNQQQGDSKRPFVAGFRPVPEFPRVSSLSVDQHSRGIRVLTMSDPTITTFRMNCKANKFDHKVFEEAQELYKLEQKEYREWARNQWVEKQCIRALRPLALFEHLYEADWTARNYRFASLPVTYDYAAQITMSSETECKLEVIADLKKVEISRLPLLELPCMDKFYSIGFPIPEDTFSKGCERHPCRIVLPDEKNTCILPTREVYTELAKYAASHKAQCIVSEKALRCMVQRDTEWNLIVTVEQVQTDAGGVSVVVIDGEAAPRKQLTRTRVARALHLLLRYALTKNSPQSTDVGDDVTALEPVAEAAEVNDDLEVDSDDEDNSLCIDLGNENAESEETSKDETVTEGKKSSKTDVNKGNQNTLKKQSVISSLDLVTLKKCTCKGTVSEHPPRVSYRKWSLKKNSQQSIPVIIHTTHKHRKDADTEAVLRVIPEYQLEMGGAALSPSALTSCALALRLRDKAQLLAARVDATNGHLITLQYTKEDELRKKLGAGLEEESRSLGDEAVSIIYETISQLCQLKPNRYVLCHEPQHGPNSLLFVASCFPDAAHTFSIKLDHSSSDERERASLQVPPVLSAALLPVHKVRRTLPLAFSPYEAKKRKTMPTKEDKKKAALVNAKRLKNAKKRNQKKKNKEKKKNCQERT